MSFLVMRRRKGLETTRVANPRGEILGFLHFRVKSGRMTPVSGYQKLQQMTDVATTVVKAAVAVATEGWGR